jgi:hypothetical protein
MILETYENTVLDGVSLKRRSSLTVKMLEPSQTQALEISSTHNRTMGLTRAR